MMGRGDRFVILSTAFGALVDDDDIGTALAGRERRRKPSRSRSDDQDVDMPLRQRRLGWHRGKSLKRVVRPA